MHKIKLATLITFFLLIVSQAHAECTCTSTTEETQEYLENRTDY